MKQVKFYDRENDTVLGGILTDEGDIICGCCGGLIEADDIGDDDGSLFTILETYKTWLDISEVIIGEEQIGYV